jgi:arylsulfatase A-like enzyme
VISNKNKIFRKMIKNLSTVFLFASLFVSCKSIEKEQQPNVLLILTDDQGWGDLQSHGNPLISTPNLDKLAQQSASFERFYVSPLCAPTRSSLLTGRYHSNTGVQGVTGRREVMNVKETTIAQIFKSAGYTTACIGKWHNGGQYPYTPTSRGFDKFYGFIGGHLNNYFNSTLENNGVETVSSGYISDVLADETIHFIRQNQQHPFFCYLAFNAPHSPFQVPDSYFDKYKNAGLNDTLACIYGMVENIDFNVGRVLNELENLKLNKKTIVVFMSDNGPNSWRYNGDMKGIKSFVDEGGVRVPGFIRFDNKIEPANRPQIAAHIDILPTLASLCNIPLHDSIKPDGINLAPILTTNNNSEALNRLIFCQNKLQIPDISVRDKTYLYCVNVQGNNELYNLKEDPGQKRNIAEQNPDLVKFYADTLQKWKFQTSQHCKNLQPLFLGYKVRDKIKLPAPDGRLTSAASFFEGHGWTNDWVQNMNKSGAAVIWDVQVIRETVYKASIRYCSKGNVLKAKINYGSDKELIAVLPSAEAQWIISPDRIKRKEAYERIWPIQAVGDIHLKPGNYELMLEFEPTSENIEFKELILELVDSP